MERETEPVLSSAELADLSALADGSLAAARRPEVEALIAASPELRERYERERDVVARLHALRRVERAPARLRARIEAERPRDRAHAKRRGLVWPAGLAVAVAAVLAIVLVIPSGTPAAPTVAQAAALAVRGAVSPVRNGAHRASGSLAEHVGPLYFPATWVGLRATGKRVDRLDGRLVVTVYYAGHGGRLAWSVVASPVLARPARYQRRLPHGYYLLKSGRRLVLTWREKGQTCVISGGTGAAWFVRQSANSA